MNRQPTFLFDLVEAEGPISPDPDRPPMSAEDQAAYERALAEGRAFDWIATDYLDRYGVPFPELPEPSRS